MTLHESLRAYQARLDALSVRERTLVLLTPVVVILVLAFNQLSLQLKSVQALEHRLQGMRSQLAQTQQQVQELRRQASLPIAEDLEISTLHHRLDTYDEQNASTSSALRLMRLSLARHAGVQVRKMRILPSHPLADSGNPPLYQHEIQLQLVGSYAAIVDELADLELSGPWYWQSLDDHIQHYPDNEVGLSIFALDRHEGLSDAP